MVGCEVQGSRGTVPQEAPHQARVYGFGVCGGGEGGFGGKGVSSYWISPGRGKVDGMGELLQPFHEWDVRFCS